MYIVGDTHGLINLYYILSLFLIEHPEIKDEYFIHVGDVGIGFHDWEQVEFVILKDIDELLQSRKCTLLCIRGNHDNPEFFRWTIHKYRQDLDILKHIKFVHDYCTGIVQGRTILFVGGAVSIDRESRREGIDYWKDEIVRRLPLSEFNELFPDKGIDTIISHSSPLEAFPLINNSHELFGQHIGDDITKERVYLSELYSKLNERTPIKNWFYGHYHTSEIGYWGDTRFECVNQDCIVEFNPN